METRVRRTVFLVPRSVCRATRALVDGYGRRKNVAQHTCESHIVLNAKKSEYEGFAERLTENKQRMIRSTERNYLTSDSRRTEKKKKKEKRETKVSRTKTDERSYEVARDKVNICSPRRYRRLCDNGYRDRGSTDV